MLATHISLATNSQQLAAFAIGRIRTLVERTVYLIPELRKLGRERSVSIGQHTIVPSRGQALVGQYLAFGELVALNQYFTGGNVSHSFIYVLTGAHGLHVVSGVVFLIIVFVSAFRYKVHSKNMNQIEMCATYWHFLGILWLYLFVFLMLNK